MASTGSCWYDTRIASHRKALCFLRSALWPFQSNFFVFSCVLKLPFFAETEAKIPGTVSYSQNAVVPNRGSVAKRKADALQLCTSQRARLVPAG